jgi:anti-sigma B factor antagonist
MDTDRLLDTEYDHSPLLVDVDHRDEPRVQHITVVGDLDALTATTLQKAVIDLLREPPRRIEINLRGVTFLDSAGIRALVLCHCDAQQRDCQLTVTDPHPMAYRVLEITGLLDHFHISGRRATRDH